jgi:hypothetical protein
MASALTDVSSGGAGAANGAADYRQGPRHAVPHFFPLLLNLIDPRFAFKVPPWDRETLQAESNHALTTSFFSGRRVTHPEGPSSCELSAAV